MARQQTHECLEVETRATDGFTSFIVTEDYPMTSLAFNGSDGESRFAFNSDMHEQFSVFLANPGHTNSSVPTSDEQSLRSSDAAQWAMAREEELRSCDSHQTWGPPMVLPPGFTAVNLGFIYAIKYATPAQGNVAKPRYKARLVYQN